MPAFDLETYVGERKERVDSRLRELLGGLACGSAGLKEAMSYSLFAGGKRFRPILLIAAHEVFSPPPPFALDAACALEMLHTYSLIHDDLPSFDNDDLRRGLATSHVVFGEWMAILAGDALNTLAFEVLAGDAGDLPPRRQRDTIRLIARAAGAAGMAGGQALDMAFQGGGAALDGVARMQALKTGALISAASEAGAILAGADEESRSRLSEYGTMVGEAFQIKDDLLDLEATAEEIGKSTGKDAGAGKLTLPSILGCEPARARARELVGAAADALSVFGPSADPLRAIARHAVARTK